MYSQGHLFANNGELLALEQSSLCIRAYHELVVNVHRRPLVLADREPLA